MSIKKKIINNIKVILRKFFPKWIRVVRENIYIDIMSFLGRRTTLTIKEFPIDIYGKNAFFSNPFISNKTKNGVDNYCAQIYGVEFAVDYAVSKRSYINFTSEIVKGDITRGESNIYVDCDSLLPISIINKISDNSDGQLKIVSKNSQYKLGSLKNNRFHYISIKGDSDINILSKDEYIIGKPIPTKSKLNKPRKKLVLAMFIDGLSSKVVNSDTFHELMPNTSKYFDNGLLSFDSYSSSNWTLPSVASLFSGLYPKNHKMNDGGKVLRLGEDYKIISEFFSDEGYLTGQICSNFRKNPGYNYVKGFDRTLYRNNMRCEEVVANAIDHLNAFKQRDNFLWLTLFDTHHFLSGVPDISIQSKMDISLHDYSFSSVKSVHTCYDSRKIELYKLELERIDLYLGMLFNYIKDNYKDDDVLISICSDHGKGFLGESEDLLSEHRVKVPMLFKSNNKHDIDFKGFSQGVDFLPTLLSLAEIDHNNNFDGRDLTKVRPEYSLSEVIYPNDYYRATIFDKKHIFNCVSNNRIKTQDDIDYDDCIYELIDANNMSKVNRNDKSLIEKYKKIIKSH